MQTVIVIAILVVLAGLVGVSASMGLRAVKSSVCRSNLSDIWRAVEMYSTDWDGYDPPFAIIAPAPIQPKHEEFKFALKGYGAIDSKFYCPMDSHAKTEFMGEWHSFRHMSYTIGIATFLPHVKLTEGDGFLFSRASVPQPADAIYLYDQTWRVNTESGESNAVSAHGDRINIVYADGHIKSIPWK